MSSSHSDIQNFNKLLIPFLSHQCNNGEVDLTGWLLPPATGEGRDGGDVGSEDTPIPTFPRNCGGRSQPTTYFLALSY